MRRSYLDTFREEAGELLQELESALLGLERDPQHDTALDQAFRLLHTLKGSGAMVGCVNTADLAHDLENLFELLRTGQVGVGREAISLALGTLDLLRATVAAESNGLAVAAADIETQRVRLQGLLPQQEPSQLTATDRIQGAAALYLLRFRPHRDLLRRGVEPVLLLQTLAELGYLVAVARLEAVPPLEELDPEHCYLAWDLLLLSGAGTDAVRDVFIFVEGESEVQVQRLELPGPVDLQALLPEAVAFVEGAGQAAFPELAAALQAQLQKQGTTTPPPAERADDSAAGGGERSGSIRVRAERLDHLVNLVGELVTIQARLGQTVAGGDAALQGLSEEIERLTWELRDEVLSIRMLPLGSTFARLRRLVRDLSGQLGKEVEFATVGAETELDKTIIDRLQEPLLHLLRNCLDHGIETPTQRLAQGKPAKGTIQVAAVHAGAEVVISVSDDGHGLDAERLVRRGIETGLLTGEHGISEREAWQLIFTPGFSTAREVTSISGRGVGMDAVRRAIEGMRGGIEVHSVAGRGTTFAIHLPLTLAIIDGLLVRVGSDQYVIPLAQVEECVELSAQAAGGERRLLALRGALLPYLRLRERFDCGGDRPRHEQVVVTNCDGLRIGLVVDEVIGGHQTVIKPLGKLAQEQRGFSGATVLGSGALALILDVPQLVGSQCAEELRPTGT